MELLDDFDILKSFFPNSEQMTANSEQMTPSSEQIQLAPEAVLLADNLAEQVRNQSKVSQQTMKSAILEICKANYISLKELAEKLERSPDTLRVHYLNAKQSRWKMSCAQLVPSGIIRIASSNTARLCTCSAN
jgi:hypothetical protein